MGRINSHYLACVFLIFIAVLYVGCTAIGYVVGDAIDEKHARSESVMLSPDSCGCEKGARIKLFLVSGDSLTGRVKEVKSGEFLRVMTRFPEPVSFDSGKVEQVAWADIQSLEVVEKSFTWRPILLSTGILIDVAIWATLIGYSVAMSAASGQQ